MRFLVFGTGRFYANHKTRLQQITGWHLCVGFLDNNKTGMLEGKPIYAPEEGIRIPHDAIVLMSRAEDEMLAQLLGFGVAREKIFLWREVERWGKSGTLHLYPGKVYGKGKRILVLTEALVYNGGAMAAIYAAMTLQQKGYVVWLAASHGDDKLVTEVRQKGLSIIVCPTLPYVFDGEWPWIEKFDVVLVNVFPMMVSAVQISRRCPVLWWIHDPSNLYPIMQRNYPEWMREIPNMKGRTLAVSSIAKRNFETFTHGHCCGKMPYGIPDQALKTMEGSREEIVCIAVIGYLEERKAQDVLLQAVSRLPSSIMSRCQFLIVGYDPENDFSKRLHETAKCFLNVAFTGVISRKEMHVAFQRDIDVVVCPSREDPLPIVVTEGMMHRKICIASDATGQGQDMIEDGVNGFVCKAGDAASLAEKMQYVIDHFDELDSVRAKARETYERYFSMKAFGDRLERELLLTEKEYWERKKQDE